MWAWKYAVKLSVNSPQWLPCVFIHFFSCGHSEIAVKNIAAKQKERPPWYSKRRWTFKCWGDKMSGSALLKSCSVQQLTPFSSPHAAFHLCKFLPYNDELRLLLHVQNATWMFFFFFNSCYCLPSHLISPCWKCFIWAQHLYLPGYFLLC